MNAGPFLDTQSRNEHSAHNFFHTVLLMAALTFVMMISAWLLADLTGVIFAVILAVVFFYTASRVPGQFIMRMYRATPVDDKHGEHLQRIVEILSDRAELPVTPKLYVIPSSTLNAFATGSQEAPCIALTEGLLRQLDLREVSAVIAHEVSHIRNNDVKILAFADTMSRITQIMFFAGFMLLLINIPLLFFPNVDGFNWLGAILLFFAPSLSNMIQMALSRTREYDADLEGASLTGDPQALIDALQKLEHYQGKAWEDMVLPGRRIPQPCLLRSHPPTESRVAKLQSLQPVLPPISLPNSPFITMVGAGPATLHPRYHFPWPGIWY